MFSDSPVFNSYSINDLAIARQFYREILGCNVAEDLMGLKLTFPNGQSVYLYQKDDHTPATFTVLNFPVEYIDTAIDELVSKGIIMERYDNLPTPQDERGVLRGKAAGMGPDIAWFRDPANNILAVLEN